MVLERPPGTTTESGSWKLVGLLKNLFTSERATGGANDIIVIRTQDGSMLSSPFHFQFDTKAKGLEGKPCFLHVNNLVTQLRLEVDAFNKALFPEQALETSQLLFQLEDEDLFAFEEERLTRVLSISSFTSDDTASTLCHSPRSLITTASDIEESWDQPLCVLEQENADHSHQLNLETTAKRSIGRTHWASMEQLRELGLKSGENKIEVSCGAIEKLCASSFVWDDRVRIVLVNVDGLEQEHAEMFQNISKNGYKLIYLSRSRAITDAGDVRQELLSAGFPQSPVLLCPLQAFTRTSATACTSFFSQSVKELLSYFPKRATPLHGAFGMNEADLELFKGLGVPSSRRYLLHTMSETSSSSSPSTTTTSAQARGRIRSKIPRNVSHFSFCVDISEIVDFAFPPCSASQQLQNFWRIPATGLR